MLSYRLYIVSQLNQIYSVNSNNIDFAFGFARCAFIFTWCEQALGSRKLILQANPTRFCVRINKKIHLLKQRQQLLEMQLRYSTPATLLRSPNSTNE